MVFLAGVLITAHEVIPHHHHFDSVYAHSNDAEDHCTEPGTDKNHEDNPIHCHAFNEIYVDRVNNESVSLEIYLPINDFYFFDIDLNESTEYYKKSRILPSRQSTPKETYLQKDSPLRGPPFFA